MKNNCLGRKKMGLSEIKSWTGLKQGTLLWENKEMKFWNTENVACMTHRSIFHSIQTTPALIKFGAQRINRNMNHKEGDSLRMVTSPAHGISKEHQIRAAAPRTRDSSCAAGETGKPAGLSNCPEKSMEKYIWRKLEKLVIIALEVEVVHEKNRIQ